MRALLPIRYEFQSSRLYIFPPGPFDKMSSFCDRYVLLTVLIYITLARWRKKDLYALHWRFGMQLRNTHIAWHRL
jgi:hypothetical protein